ncbi:MAG: Tad domain-containing protein [Coriobacteriia bacterium]|nr:Tad domain-containing protein [Coriobacteriia bacterium]
MMPGCECGNLDEFCLSDWFRDESGATSLAFALAILVSLSLIFASANFARSQALASEIQTVADASALAGANVVARYMTLANVLDAMVVTLGIAGVSTLALGLIMAAVPAVSEFSPPVIHAGKTILKTRIDFAREVYLSLSKLETAMPLLVAANASLVIDANSSEIVSYAGSALALPLDGTTSVYSEIPHLEEEIKDMEVSSEEVKELSDEAEAKQKEKDEAKKEAWLADCGETPYCMYERAQTKALLQGSLNPYYPNYENWNLKVGLLRAQHYYDARLRLESPESSGIEEQVKSVAREKFYSLALELVQDSYIETDEDGYIDIELKAIPKNTSDIKETHIYTDFDWPTSLEGSNPFLHYSSECPGYQGPFAGRASLEHIEQGEVKECPICQFSISDIGKVPQASSAINNGFEYHYKNYRDAAIRYVDLHNAQIELEKEAKKASEKGSTAFDQALKRLSAPRPKLTPPGRFGVVSVVFDSNELAPEEKLDTRFFDAQQIPARAAIAGAALAPEEIEGDNDILSNFFEGLKGQSNFSSAPLPWLFDAIFNLWGSLMRAYASGFSNAEDGFDSFFDNVSGSQSKVSNWISKKIKEIAYTLGITPPDLRPKKPVLTNTINIFDKAGIDGPVKLRTFISSLPPAQAMRDPKSFLAYFSIYVEEMLEEELVLSTLKIPGTDVEIPINLEL